MSAIEINVLIGVMVAASKERCHTCNPRFVAFWLKHCVPFALPLFDSVLIFEDGGHCSESDAWIPVGSCPGRCLGCGRCVHWPRLRVEPSSKPGQGKEWLERDWRLAGRT